MHIPLVTEARDPSLKGDDLIQRQYDDESSKTLGWCYGLADLSYVAFFVSFRHRNYVKLRAWLPPRQIPTTGVTYIETTAQ